MRNPLKVTTEGEQRWRYWWHFVNDNDRPDGTQGSLWRYGRMYVHTRARRGSSELFNVQWYLWRKKHHAKDVNLEVSFGAGLGDTTGFHSHLGLPKLGDVYLTVALPQWMLRSWIPRHGERSFGLRIGYCGYWLWLLFGFDGQNDSAGMNRWALNHPDCATCGWAESAHPREGRGSWHKGSCPGLCDSYVPKPITWKDRLREHPGFEVKVRIRLRDYLWGRAHYTKQVVQEKPVEIPLDGRTYSAIWQLTTATWRRPRAFWVSHRRISSELEVPHPPAFAGKGDNSWDCDDDGIFGLTSNATTVSGAVGDYIKAVLRNRERYGRASDPDVFQPESMGVMK